MKRKTLAAIKYGIMAIVIALAISQTTVTAQDAAPERSLEGVWLATFTPHNCLTGDPIPTAVFEAIYTFHKDGTTSVWSQSNVITVTRSPFHGLWKRENGWNEYSTKMVGLAYNLTTGALSSRVVAGGALVLGESGDEFTYRGSSTAFFVNGNPPATGCSSAVGTRFKLEP